MRKRMICCLLLLLLLPAILLHAACSLPQIYQESYYAELPALTDHLHKAEGNRLILIGGSNIAFGVDTQLLAELLAQKGLTYTVCPYGFYAAIGVSAMLALSETELRAGDVVVLALEPVSEALSTYFGATAFLKGAEGRPELMVRLNSTQRARVVGNLLPYLQEKYEIVRSGTLPKAEGVYAKAAFDGEGNMTYLRASNQMALGFDTTSPIDLDALTIEPAFAQQVNAYCRTAAQRGAQVLVSFSPMNQSAVADASGEGMEKLFALFHDTFDCTIISDPCSYAMASGWFYDSNFHLNSAGAVVRTCQLAQDLLAELGCYQAVDYELPVMPSAEPVLAQESGDTGDFLFTETAAGQAYLVSGLTAQGAAQSELSLPAAYQGKPVVGLTETALEDAAQVVELRVPEAIASLPDGALAHCTALRRLVLLHTSAPCAITEHSLDGAEKVQIFVPAAAYSWYRDGYGCEKNLWHAYIDQIYSY